MNDETSTGNVFQDLGFDKPEEELAKAELSIQIRNIVQQRGLTQKQAGNLLGISQAEVSNIVRGAVGRFTIDRLFRFLNALGKDVRVLVTDAQNHQPGTTVVVGGTQQAAV